ncbi:MAG: hypothetical protein LBU50_07345, partial [Cellulomonas sp.]|nr:hypothetical protein [Cellulomonas sp.]
TQHRTKINGRVGRLIDRMTFKCVYVDEDLDAVAPEALLIARYRSDNLAAWNTNGFGNKDPGQNRDRSIVKAGHYDALYPINLDHVLRIDPAGATSLLDVMRLVKKGLPYLFRFADRGAAGKALCERRVEDVPVVLTAREWLGWIVERMSDEWAIVSLPGYVIAYPNLNPEDIQSRIGAWIVAEGEGAFVSHLPVVEDGAVDE